MPSLRLTHVKAQSNRSLERRWALTTAPALADFLSRARTFVPADLRIWWQLAEGRGEACRVRAWPADKADRASAEWNERGVPNRMPDWIRELADGVRADMAANRSGTDPRTTDRWTHGMDSRWSVEGAEPMADLNGQVFVPGLLDVSCWVTAGAPAWENRFRADLTAADHREPARQLWTGHEAQITQDWGSLRDMPKWIAAILIDQYENLGAESREAAAAREA